MNREYQADKIVITEYYKACSNDVAINMIMTCDIDEFLELYDKHVLAYAEIREDKYGNEVVEYTQLSEPFDSYTEAEAVRLQFIHDHCELPKDNFEL